MLSFTVSVGAQEQNVSDTDTPSDILESNEGENINFKGYIGEKIIPTAIGVLAGLIGLFGSVKAIKKSLSSLIGASDELVSSAKTRQSELDDECKDIISQLSLMRDEAREIIQMKAELDCFKNELDALIKEIHNVARMVTLGFLGDEKAIRDGRGAKIYKLLEKSNLHLDQIGIKTDTYGRILESEEVKNGEKP